MDSSLMYAAVQTGEVDVITAFSTDGRIPAFDLQLLFGYARSTATIRCRADGEPWTANAAPARIHRTCAARRCH